MTLARVAVAKSSRSAASSEDLSGTFYRACRKTAPRTGAVSSLSDLCSPHDAYALCPLLAEQRLASHRLQIFQVDQVPLQPERRAGVGEVSPLRPALRERMVAHALVEPRQGVLGSLQRAGKRAPGQLSGDGVSV